MKMFIQKRLVLALAVAMMSLQVAELKAQIYEGPSAPQVLFKVKNQEMAVGLYACRIPVDGETNQLMIQGSRITVYYWDEWRYVDAQSCWNGVTDDPSYYAFVMSFRWANEKKGHFKIPLNLKDFPVEYQEKGQRYLSTIRMGVTSPNPRIDFVRVKSKYLRLGKDPRIYATLPAPASN